MSEEVNIQQVFLENVCSMEYYQRNEEEPIQVLKDISLEMHAGEIWSVIGSSAFELRLLLEIIANARPYKSGTCILARRGMLRKKRGILPHVYYIGSTNMLFDNMKVLEYMMHITAKDKRDVIERQKEMLQTLLDLQLGYLSLSTIKDLTPSERAIITLLVAMVTNSEIIIYNIARLTYDMQSKKALAALCEEIKKCGKTLIFSSFDYDTVQAITTHIACLDEGHIVYQGETQTFIDTFDHLSVVIEDEHIEDYQAILQKQFSMIETKVLDHRLELWDATKRESLYETVMRTLCNHQCYPKKIYQHKRCVENAWKEVCVHDL